MVPVASPPSQSVFTKGMFSQRANAKNARVIFKCMIAAEDVDSGGEVLPEKGSNLH
jgi:hypothetical protein